MKLNILLFLCYFASLIRMKSSLVLKCDSNDFVDCTEETYFREQVPLIKKNKTFKTYFHFFMRKKTVEPTIWKTLYGPLRKHGHYDNHMHVTPKRHKQESNPSPAFESIC